MKKENIPQKQVLLKSGPAKMISLESTTNGLVQHFGQSWLPSLENEFKKDYFQKVVSRWCSSRAAVTELYKSVSTTFFRRYICCSCTLHYRHFDIKN